MFEDTLGFVVEGYCTSFPDLDAWGYTWEPNFFWELCSYNLGTPVVPFCPFYLGVSTLKLSIRKKGALSIMGLPGNLDNEHAQQMGDCQNYRPFLGPLN